MRLPWQQSMQQNRHLICMITTGMAAYQPGVAPKGYSLRPQIPVSHLCLLQSWLPANIWCPKRPLTTLNQRKRKQHHIAK